MRNEKDIEAESDVHSHGLSNTVQHRMPDADRCSIVGQNGRGEAKETLSQIHSDKEIGDNVMNLDHAHAEQDDIQKIESRASQPDQQEKQDLQVHEQSRQEEQEGIATTSHTNVQSG
jgi:hypothetical protein